MFLTIKTYRWRGMGLNPEGWMGFRIVEVLGLDQVLDEV